MSAPKEKKKIAVKIGVGLALSLATVFSIWYYVKFGGAVSNHFYGIINTFYSVLRKPLGYGLGSGGNMSFIFNNTGFDVGAGFESALMSFMYQIGVQGIIFFSICVVSTKCTVKYTNNLFEELFVAMPFIMLGISILQDNTFTPQCIVPYMFFQGACFKICNARKLRINNNYD